MGVNERREKLARAGAWLREARSRRFPKAVDFARALDVERSLLSRYETGMSEVPDERVGDIARALGLDVITVRSGLGKWVPIDERTDEEGGEESEEVDQFERLDRLYEQWKRDSERGPLLKGILESWGDRDSA